MQEPSRRTGQGSSDRRKSRDRAIRDGHLPPSLRTVLEIPPGTNGDARDKVILVSRGQSAERRYASTEARHADQRVGRAPSSCAFSLHSIGAHSTPQGMEENIMSSQEEESNAIPLPPGAFETLQDAQRKLADIQGQLNSYIAGLRHGLNVPDGWKIDMKLKAFVPPEEKSNDSGGSRGD